MSPPTIDEPIIVLTRLAQSLDEAHDALHLAHDLERGDACLDDDDPLTWIAFGLATTLADIGDEVARYRRVARSLP